MKTYDLRRATVADIPFISYAILQAEKSFSDKAFLATLFKLSEEVCIDYVGQMLLEEMDGCEFSLSSFLIAFQGNEPVGCFGAWIEDFEDEGASSVIKSSLIGYVFPKEAILEAKKNVEIVNQLALTRTKHQLQFEYAYVHEAHRGNGILGQLINEHIAQAKAIYPELAASEVQFYFTNEIAGNAYKKIGFEVVEEAEVKLEEAIAFLPGLKKIKLRKIING